MIESIVIQAVINKNINRKKIKQHSNEILSHYQLGKQKANLQRKKTSSFLLVKFIKITTIEPVQVSRAEERKRMNKRI